MSLPASLEDVSVHLIYSEGPDKGNEDLWKLYSIALSPFVFGVPANQVTLFLHEPFLGLNSSTINNIKKTVETTVSQVISWLPNGYEEYFTAVIEGARTIDGIGNLPQCTFRFISGHGYHSHQQGGFIVCGKKVPFSDLGPNGTVLTVLDIFNSHYAVACFDRAFPIGDPKKFKRKSYFKKSQIGFPVICDVNDSTWAFRIGFQDQDDNDTNESSFAFMSIPIGDAVACSMLAAVKSFVEGGLEEDSLSEIFSRKYSELKSSFLGIDVKRPESYSNDLRKLETLIRNNVLPMKLDAYECEIFWRQNKWFLTLERPLSLVDGDDEMADFVCNYVIQSVKEWHEANLQMLHSDTNSLNEISASQRAWKQLLRSLGPFCFRLKNVDFEFDEKSSSLTRSDDGIPFESWALSCETLPRIVCEAEEWITSGEIASDLKGR